MNFGYRLLDLSRSDYLVSHMALPAFVESGYPRDVVCYNFILSFNVETELR